MTVDYFWLIGGWLRFQPPEPWLWAARTLVVGGMAGALLAWFEARPEDRRLWVPWIFVLAHVSAMLVVVFWTIPSAPQARYLFPVFAPITVLLYVGLRRVVPHALRARWPAWLVVALVVLDVTAFTAVHLPVYVP
jgi:hypothetical protein